MIRKAELSDIDALVDLEQVCFQHDRISPRSFKHFIKSDKSSLLLEEEDGGIGGYALVLYHANTSLARLYSIAVHPSLRGQGHAKRLMDAIEGDVMAHDATRLRLEVHQSNLGAQQLYISRGYKIFAISPDYYEDHGTAIRMEKAMAPHLAKGLNLVPYYAQTLEFTCGPASLIMAMLRHDPDLLAGRLLELQLWREATTIFMTTGMGGCGALGLALAAWRRGFHVECTLSDETDMFVDTVRNDQKKEVIRTVEDSFRTDVRQTDIKVSDTPFNAQDIKAHLDRGGVPICLISSYRLTGDKAPHWVVVTAYDDHFLYINDPLPEPEKGRTDTDCMGIPIQPKEFERISRFGRKKHFATLVVYPNQKAF